MAKVLLPEPEDDEQKKEVRFAEGEEEEEEGIEEDDDDENTHTHTPTHAHPLSHRKMRQWRRKLAREMGGRTKGRKNPEKAGKKCKKTGLKMKPGANLCIINHSKQ